MPWEMIQSQGAGISMSKVLIVDDSPTQLYQLRQIVERGGHQTVTAGSGEQAIELAGFEHPEVILMDIVMPGMSGRELAERFTALRSDLPVLYISGYAHGESFSLPVGERCGFLQKPFRRQDLGRKVRELLGVPDVSGAG